MSSRVQMINFLLITCTILFLLPNDIYAGSKVGTITQVSGKVSLLYDPSDAANGKSPRVLYNNVYYTEKPARIGDKLRTDNILQTANNGQARVIFSNGDHITVGPGTAYSLSWDDSKTDNKESKKSEDSLNLIYGKIRAVISKTGPRTGLKIKTPIAVAGVRGTDFFVQYQPTDYATVVSVLRGEMEVIFKTDTQQTKKTDDSENLNKSVTIATGQKVEMQNKSVAPQILESTNEPKVLATTEDTQEKTSHPQHNIQVTAITRQELIQIEKQSTLNIQTKALSKLDQSVVSDIQQLEKQAITNTLQDIKTYQPDLYEQVAKDQIQTLAAVNSATVGKLFQQAPESKKGKPLEDELKEIDIDVYKKYFNK